MIGISEELTKMFEGKAVDVVSMDFSKAFDNVLHCRSLQKVKLHGIKGLGPLLFVVYINDLKKNVAGLNSKFADDTMIGGLRIVTGFVRGYDINHLEACAKYGRWSLIQTY
eukprot:g29168.t1